MGKRVEGTQERGGKHVWFHVEDVELKWLPISEAAFLLWVLAGLVLVWLAIALVLLLV